MARILVVEDDAIQLEMRKQILEHAGHEVVAFDLSAEARQGIAADSGHRGRRADHRSFWWRSGSNTAS